MDIAPETPPYRVAVLVIDDFALMSFAALTEPMRAANLLAGRTLYEVRCLSLSGEDVESSGGACVPVIASIDEAPAADLFMVVAGGDPFAVSDPRLFSRLRRIARTGVTLGGVSGGPVILARAGLMAARRMTVHWEYMAGLQAILPYLLIEKSLYVVDRDRITCAGGTAPIDLMHAIIAGHHGPAFARTVADWFLHTDVRPSAGPQRAGLIERWGTTNAAVLDAITMMESHIADPLRLDQLADFAGLGPRQLNRLFREHLGATTMGFYRDLRLEKARNLIRNSPLALSEIALAAGFSNSAHFAAAHTQRYGAPPSALRRG
ncbi:GlxA family transcriptional regulator [Rhodobium gokarnense]|uniref:Transcriptional regulator GlxA family with amidase domain n=1 Tax=Rhodobium gokarnense TaxID=364296 RepID=A0ABT3HFY4_9HYPH|nr:GlxA family transcriptional regulator [Rhodobium gokarnense]MCW2309290.1 transcriptional regulator GlxA family with amidase domain [Rhodobium gokarnense]